MKDFTFYSLMQEPFRNIPLIWTIHEQILAARLRQYVSSGQNELVNNWRKIFSRATVVVFPNYIMPVFINCRISFLVTHFVWISGLIVIIIIYNMSVC